MVGGLFDIVIFGLSALTLGIGADRSFYSLKCIQAKFKIPRDVFKDLWAHSAIQAGSQKQFLLIETNDGKICFVKIFYCIFFAIACFQCFDKYLCQ